MPPAQENPLAPLRSAFLMLLLLAPLSCDPDGGSSDPDNEFWLTRLRQAEEELRREDMTQEERGLAMIRMARAQSGLGCQSKAVAIWEGLRTDPDADLVARARATYRLAHWYEEQERWNDAVMHYREYASLYKRLVPEQHSHFDGNTEDPASLLFHVGELQEYRLISLEAADDSYVFALKFAQETDSLGLDQLTRLYGDFLLRRHRVEDALVQFEIVAAADFTADSPPSTSSTIARVNMIECLCLLGRCKDARRALEPMTKRWAGTKYEEMTGYLKEAQDLVDQHCPR